MIDHIQTTHMKDCKGKYVECSHDITIVLCF